MASLKDKSVLVTGGNRGLGLAICQAFAATGAKVAVAGRDLALCREVAATLGGAAIAVRLDVTNSASASAAAKLVAQDLGGIDVLVNNAGRIQPLSRIAEADQAAWRLTIETNLLGAFNVSHACLPYLRRTKGSIGNISAGAADNPMDGMSAYCCSKAGLAMLTRCLADEYRNDGLRVFGFRPGMLDTDMQTEIRLSRVNKASEVDRSTLNSPAVPAAVLVRLCSGELKAPDGAEVVWNIPALAGI